jgi:CheY-like chemotaxis protein
MTNEAPMILYIDDDPDDLFIFSESIGSIYPQVSVLNAQTAEKGLELLNQLRNTHKDDQLRLIIIDMNMPKMDGRETLKEIRRENYWAHIPIVIFTTSSYPQDIEFCKNYGADYFTKPISYESLKEVMKELLKKGGLDPD